MKKNSKKKLPRYWLGTRKPTTLGYQPNKGIGDSLTSTNPGISLQPEVNAMKQNQIPNALGKAGQSLQFPMQMFQGMKSVLPTTGTAGSIIAASSAAPAGTGVALGLGGKQVASVSPEIAGTAATKSTLGTVGKVAGALGTAYGLYSVGSDIADAGSHRSLGEMRNTLGTNIYTTAGGNTYTERAGLDSSSELEYERQNRKAKQLGLGIDSIGLGASAGGLVGSIIPGVGTLLGTGIGAGLGLLAGGIASLFGFGDNEEEIKRQMEILGEETARINRQSSSEAKDADVKNAFYSGEASAALGKPAYGKMKGGNKHGEKIELLQGPNGPTIGKASSMGQPGEPMYDANTMRGSIIEGKGNQDTEPLSVKQNDATAIFSKKLGFADIAAPIVEQQNKLHDIIANTKGNPKQQQFQKMMAEKALQKNHEELLALSEVQNIVRDDTMKTKKYNCGKMPKFSLGSKIADYSSAVLPHFWGFMTNLAQKNRDKYADSYVPEMEISNPEAIKAYNQVMSDMIDPTQYLNMSQRNYNQAAWNARRAVNAGYGGRMLMLDSLYRGKQQQDAETLMKINEMNRAQRNIGANLLNQYGTDKLAKRYDQFWKRVGVKQQQNAARDYALRTDDLNMYKMWAGAANAYDAVNKYNQAYDIQNKQIGIWQQQANADTMRAIADTYRLGSPSYISPSTPSSVESTPPLLIARPDDNYAYNNALKLRGW